MDLGWEGKGFLFDSLNFTSERVTFEGRGRGCGVVGRGSEDLRESGSGNGQKPRRLHSQYHRALEAAAGDGHMVSLEPGLRTRYIPAGILTSPANQMRLPYL